MQLVGRPERSNLDLRVLRDIGVRLVGRATSIDGSVLQLNDNLTEAISPARTPGWSAFSSKSTYSPAPSERRPRRAPLASR